MIAAHMEFCPPCGGCRQRLRGVRGAGHAGPPGPARRPPHDDDRGRAAAARVRLRAQGVSHTEAAAVDHRAGRAAPARGRRARLRPRRAWPTRSPTPPSSPTPTCPASREPTVAGHGGRAVLGRIGGRAGRGAPGPRARVRGRRPRAHPRAGPRAARGRRRDRSCSPTRPARCARRSGPGALMAITDHINLIGSNLARRPERRGDRPALPEPARRLRPRAARAPARRGRRARHRRWPRASTSRSRARRFETPAEIRAFRTLGADAVGMSTVHETIVARHCGLRVAAVSAITNLAEGMGDEPLSHEQTLRDAAARRRATSRRCSSGSWRAGRVTTSPELIRAKRDGGELTDGGDRASSSPASPTARCPTPRSARSRWRSS